MHKLLLTVVSILGLSLGMASAQQAAQPAGAYVMDRLHSSLTWKVPHLGLSSYTARFTKFEATLDIDPAKPETAKLAVKIDPASIRTDYPLPDKDFNKEVAVDFFNAPKFAGITFASTKVERTGDKTAKVTGDLTLLGVTKPVMIDVTLNGAMEHPMEKKPALGFSGVAKIKRSEYGMTKFVPFIGDEVTLLIEAEFLKS